MLRLPLSRWWRRVISFMSLCLLCLTVVVGCNAPQSQDVEAPGATAGDRLVYATITAPRTIDPADSYETAGVELIYNLGDTLYAYAPGTTELKPLLATEMPTISEDGLTYTIPLRDGIVFHDGTPFTAEAMKFSLDRFMQNGGKPAFLLSDIVENVEVSGDLELTVTIKQPFSAFTAVLAYAGICAVSPEAYTIGEGKFEPNDFVGTGPYKLAEFGSDKIRLDANPDYWGDTPGNGGVDIQVYKDNTANVFNAFKTGAADLVYRGLDPDQITKLQEGAESDAWQAIEAPGASINYIALNQDQAPLDQPEVREAIAYLIDRQLIIDRVFKGEAKPLYSLVPPAFTDYSQPAFEAAYGEPDAEKAKELLAAAGFTPENPATIEVWHPSSSVTRQGVAQTLQALAQERLDGAIAFEVQTADGATFFKNIKDGIYPTSLVGWYPDFLDPDNFVHPLLSCTEGSEAEGCINGASQNQGAFYYSDRMNELIEQQRKETDPAARQALFAEIQTLLAEDIPYIPLWLTTEYVFAQNGLEGVEMNPSQLVYFAIVQK
ncbi:MAG: peptide ABC transporter substrate-binding protein [Spirulina sp. SIO3F2]|nr:peptide ABC transporter substrate-binding protein [Spirulina sp. SIO3F2]